MQVHQSEGSGLKFRSEQIAYNFHGVKTRLSILGTGVLPCGSDSVRLSLTKFGGYKRTTRAAGIATTSVFRELDWDYSGN